MSAKKIVLQEVIDELLNAEKSLIGPLMKLNYFGRLIKNSELITYTTSEINGYDPDDNVPEYRKTIGRLVVDASSYFIETRPLELPMSVVPTSFREHFQYLSIREGISTVEKMAKDMSEDGKQEFYKPLPLELLSEIQPILTKLYVSNPPLKASAIRVIGNGNVILDISGSVRTKLLEFIMAIADELGFDIEVTDTNTKAINQTVNYYMSTIITTSGDGNVVNTGNENTITNNARIEKGNLQQLKDELRKQGIDEADIAELATILQEENLKPETNALGDRSTNWILGITKKALSGVGKIATSVSANLLATMIKAYHGIDF